MAAYGTRGKLYFGTITSASVGTGGTLIADIQDNTIAIESKARTRTYRVGRSDDELKTFKVGQEPCIIKVPLRGLDSSSLDKLWLGLSSSGQIASDGSGVLGAMVAMTTTPMLIIPMDTGALYFYAGAVTLHAESPVSRFTYSPGLPASLDNELWLVATRVAGGTEPAWMFGTAAQLTTAYAALV